MVTSVAVSALFLYHQDIDIQKNLGDRYSGHASMPIAVHLDPARYFYLLSRFLFPSASA